jgi:hypothetical protein
MKSTTALILLFLLALPVGSNAQSKVGTTAAPFLTLGTGARATSLGHAFTATATGADALFWNPASSAIRNVANAPNGSLFFTHYEWFAGIQYNAFGVTVPVMSNSVIGFSMAALNYGSMDVRTVDQPNGTGETFQSSDLMVGLSYAQPLTRNFYFGGTAKYIRQTIWDMQAQTMAVDVGFILLTDYLNGLRLAASIQNFGGSMQMDGINSQIFIDPYPLNSGSNDRVPTRYETDQWELPIQFKFGVAVPLLISKHVQWEVMAESHQTNDQYLNIDTGTELRLRTNTAQLNLRAGYKDVGLTNVDSHFSFGVGIETRFSGVRMGMDMGYVPMNRLGDTKMVDMRVYF